MENIISLQNTILLARFNNCSMILFSGPSSLGDFFFLYCLYMLLPIIVVMVIGNILFKGSNYYNKVIKEGVNYIKAIYYILLFIVSNIIGIIGIWILTIL